MSSTPTPQEYHELAASAAQKAVELLEASPGHVRGDGPIARAARAQAYAALSEAYSALAWAPGPDLTFDAQDVIP